MLQMALQIDAMHAPMPECEMHDVGYTTDANRGMDERQRKTADTTTTTHYIYEFSRYLSDHCLAEAGILG